MKNLLTNVKYLTIYSAIVTVILILVIVGMMFQNRVDRINNIYAQAVPHVELINGMVFRENFAQGKISGFVKFENIALQPKDLRQYVIIEAVPFDSTFKKQIYTLQEVFVMQAVPPKYFDKQILTVKSEDSSIIDLIDGNDNLYRIDKISGEVILIDAGGDITKLITDQSAYRDFIVEWLR